MNDKLIKYLESAAAAYYAGSPFITDEVYDRLADSIGFSTLGAATGSTQKHLYQMYSLQKHYEDEGTPPLQNYPANDKDMSPKLDGAAISILYIDGNLVRVLTRGDGIEGTDITDKFIGSKLIPQSIPEKQPTQVKGEICAPKSIENARNYAAGATNLKSVEEFRTRAIEFFAYGVQPYQTARHDQDMMTLKRWGFNTVKDANLEMIYPTDGVVFRLNSNEEFDRLGYTAKFPRGAYALKARGEAVETTILDVEWGVGKTGKITPVAILEPVYIGDALVSRATLNNPGFIEALDLRIGDRVAVVRSGEIIPCIIHKVE